MPRPFCEASIPRRVARDPRWYCRDHEARGNSLHARSPHAARNHFTETWSKIRAKIAKRWISIK